MDPKQTAQLDPKLQEAYNRVMGTTVTPSSDTAASQPVGITSASPAASVTPPIISPTTPPALQPSASVTPSQTIVPSPTIASEPSLPIAPIVMPHSVETVRVGGNAPVEPTHPENAPSGGVVVSSKKGISPIILFLGAIVFLIVYSVFWVKFLNVPIPFLNQ